MAASFRKILPAVCAVAFQSIASAHPGHGSSVYQDGAMHHLTSPLHWGVWTAAVGVPLSVVAVLLFIRVRRQQRTLAKSAVPNLSR
jgi:hypothetical protein